MCTLYWCYIIFCTGVTLGYSAVSQSESSIFSYMLFDCLSVYRAFSPDVMAAMMAFLLFMEPTWPLRRLPFVTPGIV